MCGKLTGIGAKPEGTREVVCRSVSFTHAPVCAVAAGMGEGRKVLSGVYFFGEPLVQCSRYLSHVREVEFWGSTEGIFQGLWLGQVASRDSWLTRSDPRQELAGLPVWSFCVLPV